MLHGNIDPCDWRSMLVDHEIDDPRPIKVICIGAGISGIITGIRLPHHIKNLELVIYEKNHDVGGTWLENTYPGVRCDIPSPGYQLSFESNTQWSEFYASGGEIQQYMVNLAKRYDVYRFCKFNHMMTAAKWLEDASQWEVIVTNTGTGETMTDRCNVLLMGVGLLNKWKFPDIPGLDRFQGTKIHSAAWNASVDVKGKNVAVVGAGSTGIQIVPTIQPLVKHMHHYMKGRNWISPVGIGGDELLRRNAASGNFKHSEEELAEFASDPSAYLRFRHKIEGDIMQAPLAAFTDTPEQKQFHAMSKAYMEAQLKERPQILDALMPEWVPGCRRLTPGPGYLAACCEDNVDYISTPIKAIDDTGIETEDGIKRPVDVIIFATGFDVSHQTGPTITGLGGRTLRETWDPIPEAYMSTCPPGMPNMFVYFGPNGGPMTGSTMLMLEWICDYAVSAILKLQREHYASLVVKSSANAAFSVHVDRFFAKTVFTQPCNSWFKRGTSDGRVVANWPGSGVHARKTLQNPRWEDFDWAIIPTLASDPLAWMGNGLTVAQANGTFTTDYLDTKNTIDRPIPARPEVSVSVRYPPTACLTETRPLANGHGPSTP